jgi:hypothetical protein
MVTKQEALFVCAAGGTYPRLVVGHL